jgi:predicted benzoate:H+ symporter BenE
VRTGLAQPIFAGVAAGVAGIGSAFWALLVGGLVMLWFLPWPRRSASATT